MENLAENDFYHLSQEFNADVLDLLKKNDFSLWLLSFEKFEEDVSSNFISDKNYEHVVNVWKGFEMNNMKDYHDFYLQVDLYCWLVCSKRL